MEARDEHGHAIAGFTANDCVLLRANTATKLGYGQMVTWGERRSLRELGRPIQLAFTSRDTHLYAFVPASTSHLD